MSFVRCDAEYSRFYHLKYNEVNRHQHKRALALTVRKLVRLVLRLLKDNRLYVERTAALKWRGPPDLRPALRSFLKNAGRRCLGECFSPFWNEPKNANFHLFRG